MERRQRGDAGDEPSEQSDGKKNPRKRRCAGLKVELTDDPGGSGAKYPAGKNSDDGKCQSFQQKEAVEAALRAAEGLHEGEVATPLQHAGREGGEDADGDSESDEQHGSDHEGVGLVDDARLAFDELADGVNADVWKGGVKAGERGVDGSGAAGNLDLDEAGADAGPGVEGGHGQIDAAVFVAAGGEATDTVEGDGLAVVAEGDGVLVRDELGGLAAEQSVSAAIRPAVELPPAIELVKGGKIRADGDDGGAAIGGCHGEGELGGEGVGAGGPVDLLEGVWRKRGGAGGGRDDNVGAEAAELVMELAIEIGVEGKQRGRDGGGDGEGDEGREAAGATMGEGAEEEARKAELRGHAGCGSVPEGIDLQSRSPRMTEKLSCRGHPAFGVADRRGGMRTTLGRLIESPGLKGETWGTQPSRRCGTWSGIGSEDVRGVEAQGGADGGGAAGDGDEEGEGEDDRKEDEVEGCGAGAAGREDAGAEPGGEEAAEQIAAGAGDDGEEGALDVEEQSNGAAAGAERAHEADLAAALQDGRGHGGGDGKAGTEEGGGGDEPEQAGDAAEDIAFALLDLAELGGAGAGDGFADLVGDGVGVGAAVPEIALLGREGVGVAAGEGVFGAGAGGDFDAGDGVGRLASV